MIKDSFEKVELLLEGARDNPHILGKLKGVFSQVGKSRNGRYYTHELWDKCLNSQKVKEKLQNRLLLGTISHTKPLHNDEGIENTAFIMTNLQKVGDEIIGEAEIVDTPYGRILNTLLRSGVKLAVSSRAMGKISTQKVEGMPCVDADSYELFGWDAVLTPGIATAYPTLVESLQPDLDKIGMSMSEFLGETETSSIVDVFDFKEKSKGAKMAKELLEEKIAEKVKENIALIEKYEAKAKELEVLESDLKAVQDENDHLKNELEESKKVNSEIEALKETIEKYEEFGCVEDVAQFVEASSIALEELKEYKENVGSIEELEADFKKGLELIEKYAELGTPSEIEKIVEIAEKVIKENEALQLKERISKLSEQLAVTEAIITKYIEKNFSDEEIVEFVSDLKEAKKPKKEGEENDDEMDDKEDDNIEDEGKKKNSESAPASKASKFLEDFANGKKVIGEEKSNITETRAAAFLKNNQIKLGE